MCPQTTGIIANENAANPSCVEHCPVNVALVAKPVRAQQDRLHDTPGLSVNADWTTRWKTTHAIRNAIDNTIRRLNKFWQQRIVALSLAIACDRVLGADTLPSFKMFPHLTQRDDASPLRRVLTWLYLFNGVLGFALLVWFVADALWSANTARGRPLGYALVLSALALWSLSNLWIGWRLKQGSRRGVLAGVVLNVGSSLATLPAPSEAPVAVGVSLLMTLGLVLVWRELGTAPATRSLTRVDGFPKPPRR